MIDEALILSSIAISGTLLVKLLGLRGWGVMPIGFLVGCSLFAVLICLHIIFDLPLSYWYSVGLLPSALIAYYTARLWQYKPKAPSKKTVLLYGGVIFTCIAIFVAVWNLNIAVFATDTIRQSLTSSLIAGGNTEFMSSNLTVKRLNSISMLDALGFLYDSPRLRTLPLFISLAVSGSIVWSLIQLLRDRLTSRKRVVAGLAGAIIFASTYFVWWQSFYQGTHVLYGGLLLLTVISGWLLIRGDYDADTTRSSLVAIMITSIAGLMLSRPESGILVPVALAPLLVHPRIAPTIKRAIILALGLSLLLQQGIILMLSVQAGYAMPKNALMLGAAGVLLLGLVFTVQLKFVSKNWRYILWAIEILGWLALLAFTIYEPSIIWKSIIGTVKNVVFGQGLWGISYIVLLILFGLTLLFEKHQKLDIVLRYPITTMLPFGFLIGYLREGAYRAGAYDTFNRMLMHILPILVVYVVYRYYYAATLNRAAKSRRLD